MQYVLQIHAALFQTGNKMHLKCKKWLIYVDIHIKGFLLLNRDIYDGHIA